ncbi:MAG: dCTP diphosphatase [Candidatus Latescibacterota bacterium]|jgi:dCTP diphosphatase
MLFFWEVKMADRETTVGDLREAVQKFVSARKWEGFHNPKNLAMSIAIEAAEIMEHFQWITIDEGRELMKGDEARAEVADELADVMIYCLSFANATGIDVSEAILKKLARNEGRFPIPEGR